MGEYILYWYLLGVIGTCMWSHVDAKHINKQEEDIKWLQPSTDMLSYLLVSVLGVFSLAMGLYALYFEYLYKEE